MVADHGAVGAPFLLVAAALGGALTIAVARRASLREGGRVAPPVTVEAAARH